MTSTLAAPAAPAARRSEPSPAIRHVDSVDGLRAGAIALVLCVHLGLPGVELGWMGVDLFFVLSGFLITTLLAREATRSGRISLPRFWGRRFLRLMPAYWLYAGFVTIAIGVAGWGWTGQAGGWGPGRLIASIWLYFSNYAPSRGIWEHQGLVGPLWSLAIEEQFYLLWPVLFWCLGSRPARAELAAWCLVAASFAHCFAAEPASLHFRIETRGLGIMLGCAVALTTGRSAGLVRWLGRPEVRWAIVAGLALAFAVPTAFFRLGRIDDTQVHLYFLPTFCAASSLVVAMLWHGPRDRIASALSWRPMAYLGKISYGIYLYHELARHLTWAYLLPGIGDWPMPARFGLRAATFLALSVAMASLSYHTLERPFLALKSRLR